MIQIPQVNPSASEICDEVDNNCDGVADEGMQTDTWYLDPDGDGYGRNPNGVFPGTTSRRLCK